MLAKTRDTDAVLAVQNDFENDFLALLKKIFILISHFRQEDKHRHPLEVVTFSTATPCEMKAFSLFLISFCPP